RSADFRLALVALFLHETANPTSPGNALQIASASHTSRSTGGGEVSSLFRGLPTWPDALLSLMRRLMSHLHFALPVSRSLARCPNKTQGLPPAADMPKCGTL